MEFSKLNLLENSSENAKTRQTFQNSNQNLLWVSQCTQGVQWQANQRESYLKSLLRLYHGFRNVEPISSEEIQLRRKFHKEKAVDIFYQFQKYFFGLPVSITHFQVRKNFYLLPSTSEIVYSKKFGIESFNHLTFKQQALCGLAHEEEINTANDKSMICFDIYRDIQDYLICVGRADGTVKLIKIPIDEYFRVKEKKYMNITPKSEYQLSETIAVGSDILTNHVKLFNSNSLLTTNNDGYVRIFDINKGFNKVEDYKNDCAVNHCDFNVNKNILACIGDSINVEIFDCRNKKRIIKFPAHYDFGTVIKFHPSNENLFATGNQDFTCKIWDLRKLNITSHDQQHADCIKMLSGHIDSIGDLLFTQDDFLIFGENANFLHIYNIKLDRIQSLTYIGSFAGLAYDQNTSKIYIGVYVNPSSGILCYDKISTFKTKINHLKFI